MSNQTYNVLKVEEYTDKETGETKSRFYSLGVAFDNQDGDGQTLIIPEGIALTGRIITKRRKDREGSE